MAAYTFPRRVTSTATTVTVVSGGLPAWAPSPGEYADISLTTAWLTTGIDPIYLTQGVDPCPAGNCYYTLNEGQGAMWNDWNGAVFAPDIGTLGSLFMHGGGHFGYVGNEVLRYDISDRTWRRLDNPSNYGWGKDGWVAFDRAPPNVVDIYGSFPDGKPIPLHNYFNLVYVPTDANGGTLGSIVFMHRDNSSAQNVTETPWWSYNIATRTWTRGPQAIKQMQGATGNQYLGLTYDSKRKGIWKLNRFPSNPSTGISFYSMVTGQQYDVPLNSGNSFQIGNPGCGVIVYNPARDFLLMQSNIGNVDAFVCADLSNYTLGTGFVPTHQIQQAGTTADCVYGRSYGSPLEFCAYDSNHWIADWPYTSTLYRLAVPPTLTSTWQWTAFPLSPKSGTTSVAFTDRRGGDPNYWYTNHLYSRFRYVPGIKAFVWTDGQNLKVQAGRPSSFV
jgi:hypothetical protein